MASKSIIQTWIMEKIIANTRLFPQSTTLKGSNTFQRLYNREKTHSGTRTSSGFYSRTNKGFPVLLKEEPYRERAEQGKRSCARPQRMNETQNQLEPVSVGIHHCSSNSSSSLSMTPLHPQQTYTDGHWLTSSADYVGRGPCANILPTSPHPRE